MKNASEMRSSVQDEKAGYSRISSSEIVAITRMFRMYDLKLDGRISSHYCRKLLKALGTAINS
jgi:Ca2+-binding EF-hand superfamily protein